MKPVLQPRLDLLRRQDDDAGGRQLDRERDSIESPANAADSVRALQGRSEGAVYGARTLDEKLRCLGVDERFGKVRGQRTSGSARAAEVLSWALIEMVAMPVASRSGR